MTAQPAAIAGSTLVVAGHFVEKATGLPGTPAAPVTFTVTRPDATVTVYTSGADPEVTNPRTGSYVLSVATLAAEAGVWRIVLSGGGASGGSSEESFVVAAAA